MSTTQPPPPGEIWYRGESTAAPPARAGGHIHDFGDGVYFTNSRAVAEEYSRTRVFERGGQGVVLQVAIARGELGRVLDLRQDPRWTRFLDTPQVPGNPQSTPRQLIRLANENYGRFFEAFLRQNGLRPQHFDAVIGPEFVRGSDQLCILYRNGHPSELAVRIRQRLQPAPAQSPPLPSQQRALSQLPGAPLPPGGGRLQGMARNQAGIAMLGALLGSAIQALGDIGIQRRILHELETTHAAAIQAILARNEGVLVIIRFQEWQQPDMNGMRARNLLGVSLQGGTTREAALEQWRNTPRMMQGPPRGWRSFEQYAWIPPQSP